MPTFWRRFKSCSESLAKLRQRYDRSYYRSIAKEMLPKEVLSDVFRWLDRRTLEISVRLVSRKTDALVRSLPGGWPRLQLYRLTLLLGDDFVYCTLHLNHKRPESDVNRSVAKPFTVFDVNRLPSYLFFKDVKIRRHSVHETETDVSLKDKNVRYAEHSFHCIAFKVKRPPDTVELRSLYEHAWGVRYFVFHFYFMTSWLSTRYLRTCVLLHLPTVVCHARGHLDMTPPADVPLFVDWLTRPIEPSAWNPNPSQHIKHLAFGHLTNENLFDGLIEHVIELKRSSCDFHLSAGCIESLPPWSDQRWPVDNNRRTLRMSHKHKSRHLWLRQRDSSSDFCHECPYFTIEQWDGNQRFILNNSTFFN